MNTALIAVATMGERNMTRITPARPNTDETLSSFARAVVGKNPEKTYYVVAVDKATWGQRRKEILYTWHVGDGFEHKEGWWVE